MTIIVLFKLSPASGEEREERRFTEDTAAEDEDDDEDDEADNDPASSSCELHAGDGGKDAASIRCRALLLVILGGGDSISDIDPGNNSGMSSYSVYFVEKSGRRLLTGIDLTCCARYL